MIHPNSDCEAALVVLHSLVPARGDLSVNAQGHPRSCLCNHGSRGLMWSVRVRISEQTVCEGTNPPPHQHKCWLVGPLPGGRSRSPSDT